MKVVIGYDYPVVRQGIISMLTNEKNIEEVKEASNVEQAVNIIAEEEVEIAIIDLKLHKRDGLDIVARAKKNGLKTKFIVLATFISQEDFKRAEELGVDGYILKEAISEDIVYAINIISRGKKYYYPEILKQNVKLNNDNIINKLTDREKDVLREIRRGSSNEEIARSLYISEYTVKKHVSNILSKLNLSNRTQAAFVAIDKIDI